MKEWKGGRRVRVDRWKGGRGVKGSEFGRIKKGGIRKDRWWKSRNMELFQQGNE